MKRRQLIGYAGVGLVTAVIANLGDQVPVNAQNSDVSIQWLGHTCFLLTTENVKILINPFNNL
ncbi:MAG: MBL fold metallo-hydrolase, partial [Aphanizomenon sp.]